MAAIDRIGSGARFALVPLRPIRALAEPLMIVPRLAAQLVSDVNSIAASTRTLTLAVQQLDSINERVESLNDEVARMRAGVEKIRGDIDELHGTVEPLGSMAARFRRRGRRSVAGGEGPSPETGM